MFIRLDPSGRGKGDCELLSIPLSRVDIGRDIIPDPDYDYYERDRNADSVNCRRKYGGNRFGGSHGYDSFSSGGSYDYDYRRGSYYPDRRYDYKG